MTNNNELVNISNRLDTFKDTILDTNRDSIIDNDDNKSVTSNTSNLTDKQIISNISKSIREKFTKNNDSKEEIINHLNDTISTWNSNIDSNVDSNTTNIPKNSFNNIIGNETIGNENIEIPNSDIIFMNEDLNEIKLFKSNTKKNNIDILSSINSESEVSYTTIANKQKPLDGSKISKHIRGAKHKNRHKDDNELDEVDYLYNKLQDYIRYMTITRYNYILLIVKAMEIIENNPNNNINSNNISIYKKNTVTKALNRIFLIDLNLSDFDQTLFLSSLNNIIEIIIICSKSNSTNKYNSKNHIYKYNNDDLILASAGQIIHSLIDKITTIIIKKKYNSDKLFVNICTITDILMILVNKYNYINSIEKKTIVIQAFTIFITEKLEYIIDLSKEKKNKLILALDSIPFIIDLLIALQNGKYKINRKIINDNTNKTSSFRSLCCFTKNNTKL